MEGPECFREDPCDANGLAAPVAAYRRDVGAVVTGGYVYRGRQFPELQGAYLFADFTNGKLWYLSAPAARQGPVRYAELLDSELVVSSFGEDEAGELYVTDLGGGGVYRLVLRRG